MDFDLFEDENDADIFGTVRLEPTQHRTDQLCADHADRFLDFCCNGEDKQNSRFSPEGFITNSFIAYLSGKIKLSKNFLDTVSLTPYNLGYKQLSGYSTIQYLFGETFMNVQHLVASVQGNPLACRHENNEQSSYKRRRHVTKLLQLILYTTNCEQSRFLRSQLNQFQVFLKSISTKDLWKSIYFANSCKGNECNVPSYHMLHGILEWKYLLLCISFKFEIIAASDGQKRSTFIIQLKEIFDDLLNCSLYLYDKKRISELLYFSPFPCTCIKELWLLLQLSLKQWTTLFQQQEEQIQLNFWLYFNEAIAQLKLRNDSNTSSPINHFEFVVWLIQGLIRLFGYRSNGQFEGPNYALCIAEVSENYELIEQCTLQFLNLNPNEEQLRVYICLLTPILLEWWRPRASIAMMLWEYFHKRLNSAFYASGTAPNNLAVACSTGRAYLEKYRSILAKTALDANFSSYTLFVLLLGKCLERLRSTTGCGNQAQKLLGRIFSKFSLQKFLSLNETGIHHIIELFLILALCGDFEELAPKLRDQLLSISLEKVTMNRQIAITKGHMSLLILSAENRIDLSEYVTKLLQQLNSVRNDLSVAKIIADSLLDIIQCSDGNFRLGEHLLIDTWLPSLLQNCRPVEQERILEALHLIFCKYEKHNRELLRDSKSENILKSLNNYILPFIRQQYATSFSDWVPQLAADFCLNLDTETFNKLLNFFIETPTISRQILPQLILKIVNNDSKPTSLNDDILLHVWLKSLVLLTPQNVCVSQLTKHIVERSIFYKMTNLEKVDILQAKEPLCVFIAAVGKVFESSNYEQKCEITDRFNAYVRNFDKWLMGGMDTKLEQQPEITVRFYSFLAIVIFNCPNIVYAKSKSNCFFHIAITRFVLPTSVQIGKAPEGKLTQLVHKIWPVLVQGIGRLNFKSDGYIQKTLNDLIQKWTPLFKTISPNVKIVARPFTTCLLSENRELSLHICERLTSLFLITQRRHADPHACLVISIFQEIVSSISQEIDNEKAEQHMETFVKGTCLSMLEHIMMVDEVVPSRGMLLDLFRRIVHSNTYKKSLVLQNLVDEHLRIITKKHLAYYTFFYFDLLMKLARISHEIIMKLMQFLLKEVNVLEQKRGTDKDNRIRNCLQQLQQCINIEKKTLN